VKKLLLIICAVSFLAFGNLPFEIEADHIKFTNKDKDFFATGNIIVKYKTYTIYSEEAEFKHKKYSLNFNNGARIMDKDKNEISADSISLNLSTDVGHMKNGHIKTSKDIIIRAQNIVLEKNTIKLLKCSLTSCTSKLPEWYIKSDNVEIDQVNNIIHANKNTLYFYNLPIFYVPSFSQSNQSGEANNKPTPEVGYNQIDKTYINVYLGYLISQTLSGKAGFGISTERGLRYGASHLYNLQKNHTVLIETYLVEKTGFEGGLRYKWIKHHSNSPRNSIVSSLLSPTKNNEMKSTITLDYLYNHVSYNELYNALPELKYNLTNAKLNWGLMANTSIATGYYEDSSNHGDRNEFTLNLEKNILNTPHISNGINIDLIEYSQDNQSWHRAVNYLSIRFPLFMTKNTFTYSHLLYEFGNSPFIFDSINELNQDELGMLSTINLLPIILTIDADYQLKDQSFRNLKYTFSWVFQCWQLDFSIDTIWEEINFGASIPLF
jgi:lipopolysaccharide export system protein LptA